MDRAPRGGVDKPIVNERPVQKIVPFIYMSSMQDDNRLENDVTDVTRRAWRQMALGQGLVCVVCKNVPKLERRGEFFDTGLCARCSTEINQDSTRI